MKLTLSFALQCSFFSFFFLGGGNKMSSSVKRNRVLSKHPDTSWFSVSCLQLVLPAKSRLPSDSWSPAAVKGCTCVVQLTHTHTLQTQDNPLHHQGRGVVLIWQACFFFWECCLPPWIEIHIFWNKLYEKSCVEPGLISTSFPDLLQLSICSLLAPQAIGHWAQVREGLNSFWLYLPLIVYPVFPGCTL